MYPYLVAYRNLRQLTYSAIADVAGVQQHSQPVPIMMVLGLASASDITFGGVGWDLPLGGAFLDSGVVVQEAGRLRKLLGQVSQLGPTSDKFLNCL